MLEIMIFFFLRFFPSFVQVCPRVFHEFPNLNLHLRANIDLMM